MFLRSILDTIKFIILLIYYCFEAFILMFFSVQKDVSGQIVLVTGSANGIGRQIALNFARLCTILVLWDTDEENNKETAELALANGALAVYTYKCDLCKKEEIYAVADQTCKAFLPAMIACNQGHLVTITSVAALCGCFKLTDYSASKFAAFGFMESIAFELRKAGKKGIKTTIVCPGFVDTKLITNAETARPILLPVFNPEYVGKRIVDAILKDKFYVVLPTYARLILLKIFLPEKVVSHLAEYLGI
ncbi:short-chain dehydrogenase/reductase family 16C member 6 isoform X2 [Anolis carolinensis]|uniref:short-chain dehydrogenase/reductase family 16C member 6 isoform X2 n=1 Tax=Anolis carolinensis TaxID=28377 RepID=UPI0007DB7C91|nr:PREDICTED: short-chain dehydrogenase/reductase family 16C member 6-like isoform X2 [Anolis carolinensis]|eukprot:XP_016853515.1 PREDICTED: short-chain dehydrogenase/reductase family 16C member 6-like isoform X2 [Anolis carolinensis]